MHECGFGLVGPHQVHVESPDEAQTTVVHLSIMKSLSDVVNDGEDCSGVISSTIVTELFIVFSLTEWLFGIWINVVAT